MPANQLLDQVQSLARLAMLADDPRAYTEAVEAELGDATSRDELAMRDDRLRDALARIDAFAERAMRIRLDHLLADDPTIAIATRKVFASTVTGYVGRLELLESRAHDAASRGGSRDPARAAGHVVDATEAALALRGALRDGIMQLAAALATPAAALADRHARDRRLEEPPRRAWSALRRELLAVAADPTRIAAAALAARLATWPEQLDEPDPAAEPTIADLIELD